MPDEKEKQPRDEIINKLPYPDKEKTRIVEDLIKGEGQRGLLINNMRTKPGPYVLLKSMVGAIYAPFIGGRKVPIYPIVQAEFPSRETLYAALQALDDSAQTLIVTWRDREDSPKEGRRRILWIHLPDNPNSAFISQKVSPEHRDLFERLRAKWGFWNLELSAPGVQKIGLVVTAANHVRLNPNGTDWNTGIRFAADHDAEEGRKALSQHFKGKPSVHTNEQMTKRESAVLAAQTIRTMEELGGPLPWRIIDDQPKARDHIVQTYIACMSALHGASKMEDLEGNPPNEETMQHNRLIWAKMRTARIFEMSVKAYVALHHAADLYTTKVIAGLDWRPTREEDWQTRTPGGVTDEEAKLHYHRIREAGRDVAMPEKMPFDTCYLAWGTGVPMHEINIVARGLPKELAEDGALLMATLITSDGNVTDFLYAGMDEDKGHKFYTVQHRTTEHAYWAFGYSLMPWIVNAAIAGINEHRALIEQQAKRWEDAKSFKRAGTDMGLRHPIPPPYYTVYMHDTLIRASARKEFRRQTKVLWSHRWDVRGHEIVRVRRGKIPIDPRLERILTKREYKIFVPPMSKLDADTYRVLLERGMKPPEPDEWIAVLISWRNAFIKGPKDAPYVPSVRRATKGVIAVKEEG